MRFILVIFAIITFVSCNQQPKDQKQEVNPEVIDASSNEAKDTLLDAINKKLRSDINNADLYLKRADYYLERNQFNLAKQDLDRAYLLDTTELNPILAYADYYLKVGDLPTTKFILDKGLVFHNESSALHTKLSELYLYARDGQKSMEYADLAVKYDMYNAKAYFLKGYNFLNMGDTNRAISSYQTAVEQDPDYFEAYVELGLIHAALKDPLAIQYYDNALSIKPDQRNILYSKGMFYQEQEMYNEAMSTYQTAMDSFPDFREAYYNMGYVHMSLELYNQAVKYFSDAIQVDPSYHQAYYNRGYCFELLGDVNAALKDYDKALEIQPNYTIAAEGKNRVLEPIN